MVALAVAAPLAAQVKDWKEIKTPPLREFKPQMPLRVQLPNGMVIFLQRDAELPLIDGFARIRGGSREEPAAKTGLVSIYGQAWRTGGTKQRTGDQLDDFLEMRAARVETGGGLDSATISFSALKQDFEDVFGVFLELLREPEFREDKIDLAKRQLNTGISRRNDDVSAIAGRESTKLGYGPDSPYSRVAEYDTVAAVTREDLLEWHKKTVHPNNIILGIVGDFEPKQMEARLRQAFASWAKGPAMEKLKAEFKDPKAGVYFIPKDDVNQSQIRMVHLGTTRDNPDYYALEVMNEVLAGGFSGRLLRNIRSKKGLAYSAGGGVGTNFDHPGLFRISMGTKSETTAGAIDALYAELEDLKRQPATEEELTRARQTLLNSFIFQFDSKAKILREHMLYEFHGYPLDFLQRYPAGIEKVNAADVARVAEKYVHKDKLAVLVVGKANDFDRPLASLGEVKTIDIAIPPPGASKKKETVAGGASPSSSEGRALFDKAIAAMGGKQKLAAVKAVRFRGNALEKTPQGDLQAQVEALVVYPDRMYQKLALPMGELNMVVSPDAAFMSMGPRSRDLPASQKEELVKEIKRDPVYLAQNAESKSVTFSVAGKEKVGDKDTSVLLISADGVEQKWYLDDAGNLLRSEYDTVGQEGPRHVVNDYSDLRPVEGIVFAFKSKRMENGAEAGTMEIREVQINPEVDQALFQKPAPPSN
jgi:zinc protease